jgi:hypothetical protein
LIYQKIATADTDTYFWIFLNRLGQIVNSILEIVFTILVLDLDGSSGQILMLHWRDIWWYILDRGPGHHSSLQIADSFDPLSLRVHRDIDYIVLVVQLKIEQISLHLLLSFVHDV